MTPPSERLRVLRAPLNTCSAEAALPSGQSGGMGQTPPASREARGAARTAEGDAGCESADTDPAKDSRRSRSRRRCPSRGRPLRLRAVPSVRS